MALALLSRRLGSVFATACLLHGCAAPQPRLGGLKPGDEIEIAGAGIDAAAGALEFSNRLVGENAGKGALGGAAFGALMGLTCGPFFLVCVPMGALVAGLSGGAVGAMGGVAEGLPVEAREQLTRKMQASTPAAGIQAQLVAEVARKAGRHMKVASGSAPHRLEVRLRQVGFVTGRDERVSLNLQVDVRVAHPGDARAPPAREKRFAHSTSMVRLALWLDDREDYTARTMRSAMEHLADDIVADLLD